MYGRKATFTKTLFNISKIYKQYVVSLDFYKNQRNLREFITGLLDQFHRADTTFNFLIKKIESHIRDKSLYSKQTAINGNVIKPKLSFLNSA